jgi:hypothetical protein
VSISPIPGSRFATHVDEWIPAVASRIDAAAMGELDDIAGRISGNRSFDPHWTSQRGDLVA